MEGLLPIAGVARRYQVSPRALRYYEEAGLLQSHQAPGSGYRFYDAGQIMRLESILTLRGLGFTIREAGALLEGRTGLGEALQGKLAQSRGRLAETRDLADRLEMARNAAAAQPLPGEGGIDHQLKELAARLANGAAERRNTMPILKDEPYAIAIGRGLFPIPGGAMADALSARVRVLREGNPALPKVRIFDTDEVAPREVRLIWAGEEACRYTSPPMEPDALLTELTEKLARLYQKE